MPYALEWQFSVVEIASGAGPMSVPAQQVLTVSQRTNFTGGTPPGLITVPSTGTVPTAANMVTALNAAATAAAAILNANPALTQWQGFATGGG